MTSKEYWKRRSKELSKLVDADADEVIKIINEAYATAAKNIDREIARWYQKFADNNEMTYQEALKTLKANELKDFKMTLEEYIKHGEELDVDPSWLKAMKNASAKHHIDRLTAEKMLIRAEVEEAVAKWRSVEWMDKVVSDAYQYSTYTIQTDIQVGWHLNEPDMKKLQTVAKKPWTADGLEFVERVNVNNAKLVDNLQKQLAQSCIRGDSYETLGTSMSQAVNLAQYEAVRIIRTESTSLASDAEMQSYKDAGIKKYEVLVTLDNKTCEKCAPMDGLIFNVADAVKGENEPPFHPNCRCDTIGFYDVEFLTRAARDRNGKTIYVPKSMKYDEWKEIYGI